MFGLPCVMEQAAVRDFYTASEQEQPLSDKCTITPLDNTTFQTTNLSRPQVGDIMSYFFTKFQFSQHVKFFDDPTAR